MGSFANGKYAFGFCDRTGFRYKLKDLVPQVKAGRMTGLMATTQTHKLLEIPGQI